MDTELITLKELTDQLNNLLIKNPQYENYHIIIASECGYSGAALAQFIDTHKFISINEERKQIKLLTDDDDMDKYDGFKIF